MGEEGSEEKPRWRRGSDTLITKGDEAEKQIGALFTFHTLFANWER